MVRVLVLLVVIVMERTALMSTHAQREATTMNHVSMP